MQCIQRISQMIGEEKKTICFSQDKWLYLDTSKADSLTLHCGNAHRDEELSFDE